MMRLPPFLILALAALATTQQPPPAEFIPNPRVGPGGSNTRFKDSPHFRIYNPTSDAVAAQTISYLEAAHTCFVDDLKWRTPGLSYYLSDSNTTASSYHKINIYQVDSLPGAAANTPVDLVLGLSYLNVVKGYMNSPEVVVHEFGHALTYSARWWIDQYRTGAWWETVANFVADLYLTSPVCARARSKYNQPEGQTIIDLKKVIGDSFQVIVDGTVNTGNYYQAWPFLMYLFNNPDKIPGLGMNVLPDMWTKYKRGSDETPLHVLERIMQGKKVQEVVARYWARMAFVDIGHLKAREKFEREKGGINYANLDSLGGGRWRVKSGRRPRYLGGNIIPLRTTTGGNVGVSVTGNTGPITVIMAVKSGNGSVRYVDLKDGSGQVVVAAGEEAALVVVNTPNNLVMFDPFKLTGETNTGVDYYLQLTGATV
ncbi:hypothetical protein QBC38DRAFT_476094 [Podospora fimiseda]|uniref:Dockerin type 1 n=1 Tax=Podospora fimiseda TaxID=252190 RepID=A0AAN7BR78_9PEZI|nr:hypothetical protein QBC38DRAFT_476094 [Podospora fimiseda]